MPTHSPHWLRSFALRSFLLVTLLAGPGLAGLEIAGTGLAWAQPAPYIYVPNNIAGITVIDPVTESVVTTFTPDSAGPVLKAAAVSPDGRRLYSASSGNNFLRVVDLGSGLQVAAIDVGLAMDIAMVPDGSAVWLASYQASSIAIVDTASNSVTATIPLGFSPYALALMPNGQQVVVAGGSSGFALVDIATRTVVRSLTLSDNAWDVVVHPNGHTAYVSLLAPGVAVVDLDTGTQVATIPLSHQPVGLAMAPNGSSVYVVEPLVFQGPGAIRVIATATNTITATINTGYGASRAIFSADGSRAYVSAMSNSNSIGIVNTATRTNVGNLPTGFYPEQPTFGPALIRADCTGCADTTAASDADLTTRGFDDYVRFFHGTLSLTGVWSTNRTISLLSNGSDRTDGVIDTANVSNITLAGGVIGEGVLVKRGAGGVILTGDSTNVGGSRVERGFLSISGHHAGPVAVTALGLLHLTAGSSVGAIQATSGIILADGHVEASQMTASGNATVSIPIDLEALSSQPLLQVAGTADIDGARFTFGYNGATPMAPGTVVTLLTHATGRFQGWPDNTMVQVAGRPARLTYHWGSGSDFAVLAEAPPTIAPLTDRTIVQDATLGPVTLDVADTFTAPGVLTITATSSNQALVPNANLSIGNTGSVRTLTATPLFGASGQTTITVTVTDEAMLQAQQSFVLTVIPTRSYYLAEGATGGFFSTDILLANPNNSQAPITITFYKDDGSTVTREMTLTPSSRTTVRVDDVEGMEAAAFSTTVVSTSGVPLVVERTMEWDASGYGSSMEKAGTEGARTWYFAEGSQGFFHTYFLLFNPNVTATVAHVTYLMEDGPAIVREYAVPARTRVTVDAAERPELLNRSFGARVEFDQPGLAERSMYFGERPLYVGGAAAAGVTAPATSWYLAEGATGSFFETFVLIANPNDAAANLTVTYLPEAGAPVVRTYALAAEQRLTLNIALEDPSLASAAVSTRVESDRPVVVERSQYWPRGAWYESHSSAGETSTGLSWGMAEGRVGGDSQAQTFILIANPGATEASISATFLRTDGPPVAKTFTVPPASRFTIAVTGDTAGAVPELTNESFGTIINASQPVIVEHSLYTSRGGTLWTAGSNSTATRLVP